MHYHRKLLVLGTNHLLAHGHISPNGAVTHGHVFTEIAARNSVVCWSDAGHEEVRISVWWDYDHDQHPQANKSGNFREGFRTSAPLAKHQHYPKFVGAFCSGWLERKDGLYLQGKGSRGIFDTYCRRGERDHLEALPTPSAAGYAAEGKFHM